MNEWNFDRFFPKSRSTAEKSGLQILSKQPTNLSSKSSPNRRSPNSMSTKEGRTTGSPADSKQRYSLAASQTPLENRGFSRFLPHLSSTRRKEEIYSRSMIPRVFRREHTDVFTPVRHSSIFIEGNGSYANEKEVPGRRRGSDASLIKYAKKSGEQSDEAKVLEKTREWKPTRPRREKTEGDIVMRRHRQELRENLEARRLDVEMRFSEEATKMKNRNSRILITPTEFEDSANQVSSNYYVG